MSNALSILICKYACLHCKNSPGGEPRIYAAYFEGLLYYGSIVSDKHLTAVAKSPGGKMGEAY